MNKNKFEKQGSGLISLNLNHTPLNRQFGDFKKEPFDELSFTKKSEDILFPNNAFGDYVSNSQFYRGKQDLSLDILEFPPQFE